MDTSVLSQYGLAGLVIAVQAAVILYQNRKIDKLVEDRASDLREQITAAANTRDKLTGPLQAQAEMLQRIYDLVATLLASGNLKPRGK